VGRLTATVPSGATEFTVRTPTSEIVDLGTEFGVEVDEQGNSMAVVLSGRITAQQIGGKRKSNILQLFAGEQTRVIRDSTELEKSLVD